MRALTVLAGRPGSLAVSEVPGPPPGGDTLLVDGLALGVCGTDREIVAGGFGSAPRDRDRLVVGHESLGRVRAAPPASEFSPGDLVVGMVRRPDPVPCGACVRGEVDMCRNGRYLERGIKGLDGYGADTWRVEPHYAVRLDPHLDSVGVLLEPTSVVAKAWDHIDRVGGRAWFEPGRALVTGAGSVGLLAALLGVQRGLDVHVLDQVEGGAKPRAVAALGATYHTGDAGTAASRLEPDVIVEATGALPVIRDVVSATGPGGVACLVGVSGAGEGVEVDIGAFNDRLVLGNRAVFGSVNANLRHYRLAVDALGAADRSWLEGLITRKVPLDRAHEAFEKASGKALQTDGEMGSETGSGTDGDDIKVVIDLAA